MKRQDKGNTPYNLRNCAYHNTFRNNKVIWIELVDRGRFAYDDSGMYIEATAFMITGDKSKYLCAFLNSRLVHWYIRNTAPTSGMGTPRWKKVYVEQIPVAIPRLSDIIEINKLVDQARTDISSNYDLCEHIEKRIDKIIYNIYDISAEQENIIEMATNV